MMQERVLLFRSFTRCVLVFAACASGFIATAHADRLYVSNEDGHSVTVIDTQSAAVVDTIAVGKRPRLYASTGRGGTVTLFLQSTAAARFTFYLSKLLREPLGLVGVTEDAAALARQRCVPGERTGLDELVVAQLCGDAVDRTRALVQAGELPAIRCNAIVHVLDPRDGRVIVGGRIGGLVGSGRGRGQQTNQYGGQYGGQHGGRCDRAGVA